MHVSFFSPLNVIKFENASSQVEHVNYVQSKDFIQANSIDFSQS